MATISICAKILSTIASPAFTVAYEKGVSIWEAKDELNKLKLAILTIQAVLNDAESKQEGSDAIKDLIQRLKGVLYDADDLFEEVLAEDLLKQQMMDGKNVLSFKKKVHVFGSTSNPILSRNSIAKKVKAVRKRLEEISIDMDQFRFVQGQSTTATRREIYTARGSIDAKLVVGRDLDKSSILEILFNGLSNTTYTPMVIAIDGIGGMGKTTLAHLIYNDEKVKEFFEKRWFACVSDLTDDRKVLEKIYQSICEENCSSFTLTQLEDKIRESLKDKKYLLVLDDVWEDDHGKWTSRKKLLSSGANGSRIIVTTRLQTVVSAVGAVRAHNLKGLSKDDSWDLFKKLAFASGYENDPIRESMGRELLKRCRGLPLAIWCMGGLLYNKTLREWEEIESVGLPTLRGKHNDEVIGVLKLSYDHLPSNLKQCFTYCSLFPKDYRYKKEELIYHWIAQGYINLNEGESSFMYLLRMGFFQEVGENELGEIVSCKMHDIMHDLAMHLSGKESIVQGSTTFSVSSCTRYVVLMVKGEEVGVWDIPTSLLNFKSIRSCILEGLPSQNSQQILDKLSLDFRLSRTDILNSLRTDHIPHSIGEVPSQSSQQILDKLFLNFRLSRTMILKSLRTDHIPPSIGELKLVRYLDLSGNRFERLPNSITNLVNLIILDLHRCVNLTVWPLNFKKLIKLRSLKLEETYKLLSMPEGIGGMVSLQNVSDFKVQKWSQLDESAELLKRLSGSLIIQFVHGMEVGEEGKWQLPAATSLQDLRISSYPGHGIWGWGKNESTMKLERLKLDGCKNVKHLPSMRCFPGLKWLELKDVPELEYMEEPKSEEVNPHNSATSYEFFRSLEKLLLNKMEKLKGWQREVATKESSTSSASSASAFFEFSHLSKLYIDDCPNLELKSFPQCPSLRNLILRRVGTTSAIFLSSNRSSLEEIGIFSCKFLSGIPSEALTSLRRRATIENCPSLKSLQLASPHLINLTIRDCKELVSIELAHTPSLQSLRMWNCKNLKSSLIACSPQTNSGLPSMSMSSLRDISISGCTGLISLPWTELTSLEECYLNNIDGLQSVHIPSPHLQKVDLAICVGLKSVEVEAPALIRIVECYELKNLCIAQPTALGELIFSLTPSVVDWGSLTAAFTSLETVSFYYVYGLKMLNFKSPNLRSISIDGCRDLTCVEIHNFTLYDWKSRVSISRCSQLNNVRIPRPIALQHLMIEECTELSLSTGVDWASLPNLKRLQLCPLPPVEEVLLQLPQCLRQRHTLNDLQIAEASVSPHLCLQTIILFLNLNQSLRIHYNYACCFSFSHSSQRVKILETLVTNTRSQRDRRRPRRYEN